MTTKSEWAREFVDKYKKSQRGRGRNVILSTNEIVTAARAELGRDMLDAIDKGQTVTGLLRDRGLLPEDEETKT